MSNFKKELLNPLEVLERVKVFCKENCNYELMSSHTSHIEFDPDLRKGQFDIVRGSAHDGTLYFTLELYLKAFENLISQTACYARDMPDVERLKRVEYRIGYIKHSIVRGKVMLPCSTTHKYPGIRERVRIPVVCYNIY